AMSDDFLRMLRSSGYLAKFMRGRHPALKRSVAVGGAYYAKRLLVTAIQQRRYLEATRLGLAVLCRSPARAVRVAGGFLRAVVGRSLGPMVRAVHHSHIRKNMRQEAVSLVRFAIGDPGA